MVCYEYEFNLDTFVLTALSIPQAWASQATF